MAYTQADVDALKAAIATGARKVRFGAGPDQREVEYAKLADLERALAIATQEVSGTGPVPRASFVEHYRD